jgi:hypothetical protein
MFKNRKKPVSKPEINNLEASLGSPFKRLHHFMGSPPKCGNR